MGRTRGRARRTSDNRATSIGRAAPPADLERRPPPRLPDQPGPHPQHLGHRSDDRMRKPGPGRRRADAAARRRTDDRRRRWCGPWATRSGSGSSPNSTWTGSPRCARAVAESTWSPPTYLDKASQRFTLGSAMEAHGPQTAPARAGGLSQALGAVPGRRSLRPCRSAIRCQPGERFSKAISRLLSLGMIAQRMFHRSHRRVECPLVAVRYGEEAKHMRIAVHVAATIDVRAGFRTGSAARPSNSR